MPANISPEVIRGYVDTIILSVLLDEPSYGYDVSRQIAETSEGRYTMKETTLYSAFSRLERNGLVVSFPGTETKGRPRTYYRVTASGREHYAQRCHEWKLTRAVVDSFIDLTKGE
jgi:PadR family transcriptional regulator PadR